MNRRQLIQTLGAGGIALGMNGFGGGAGAQDDPAPQLPKAAKTHDMSDYGIPSGKPQQVAMLIYPQMTALDLIVPTQIFSALANIEVHYNLLRSLLCAPYISAHISQAKGMSLL